MPIVAGEHESGNALSHGSNFALLEYFVDDIGFGLLPLAVEVIKLLGK